MKTYLLATTAALITSAAVAQDITLTYMMWDPNQLGNRTGHDCNEFEAANPGVTVEAQAMPPSDYWPRLSALAASGDLPDVFAMSSGFVDGWAAAGNLMDLTEVTEGYRPVGLLRRRADARHGRWQHGRLSAELGRAGAVLQRRHVRRGGP